MKTILPIRVLPILILVFMGSIGHLFSQELVEFRNRYPRPTDSTTIRGNLTVTGNDIVGIIEKDGNILDPNASYNVNNTANGDYVTAFIDIDGDPTTFSSSSASLRVPDVDCSDIVYAGLYWSANYYMARRDNPITRNGNNGNTNTVLIVNNGQLAGQYRARPTDFGNDISDIKFSPATSYLVVADQPGNDCTVNNLADLAGNIAVLRHEGNSNGCTLRDKVVIAQNAGAVGVVIVNNSTGSADFTATGGTQIFIPSVLISNLDFTIGGNLADDLLAQTEVVLGTISTTGNAQLNNLPQGNDPRRRGPADFRNVKFKVPGGAYIPITAQTIVWDGYRNTITNNSDSANDEVQYVCYADVTEYIDPTIEFGEYTVADINATQGYTSTGDGACGGWMLVVVYRNPLESSKFISTREGYVQIFAGDPPPPPVAFDYTGFQTLPGTQPVDVSFGVAALEGDKRWLGDRLQIRNTAGNFVNLGNGNDNFNDINPVGNFFNSSITLNGNFITPRTPESENTMGFDIDLFQLPNAGNTLIGNNQNTANFRILTEGDRYSVFFGSFAVTVIEPELLIIKRVYDTDGVTEITGGNVELGDEVFYDLEIENIGNEDLLDGTVTITDILPANTNLLAVTQVPPGVTFTETTPGTLVFNIPADLVETNLDGEGTKDAPIFIRFRAQLVASCEELRDACSDIISNSATADYIGELSGEPGFTSSVIDIGPCRVNQGEASNILVNVPPCSQDVTFCNDNLTLVAGTGYDQYTWTGPGIPTPVIQLTATNPNANVFVVPNPQTGIYQVVKEDLDPNDGDDCMTLVELFDVEDFRDIQNPILNYVNGTTVVTESCSGLEIPQILLCGDQTFELMTNFSSTNLDSISWQRLSPSGSCVLDPNDPCSLLSGDCTDANWVEEPGGNTANFTVSVAGDYRILAEFDGGCLIPFYFSVYKNDYQPELDMNPIECGNDGSVTVTNVPNNFAFSLTQGGPYTNTTGIFPITTPGDVTVYAIDTTFPGCEYTATINVPSFDPVFTVTATSPSCVNDDNGTGTGSILINITGGTPEYQYTIDSPVLTNPIVVPNSSANNGNYVQNNLLPGTYTVEMISNRPAPECIDSETVIINPAPDFDAFARLFAPPTCVSGALIEIVVTSGSGNYLYDDGSGNFQTSNIFEVPSVSNPGPNFLFYVSDNSVPAGSPACIIEVPFSDPIPPYQPIVLDNFVVTPPPCPGDGAQVQVDVSPSVAGRTYLYELITVTTPTEDSIYNVISSIGITPLQTATFPNVVNSNPGEFYRVRITHNNTTPPGTTPATICPVFTDAFVVDDPDAITADVTLERPLSCNTGTAGNALIRIDNIQGGSGNYAWSFNPTTGYQNIASVPLDIPIPVDGGYTIYIANQGTPITCAIPFDITVPARLEIDSIVFDNERDSDCENQTITVDVSAAPALSAADIANGVVYQFTVTPAPAAGPATFTINTAAGVQALTFTRGIPYSVTATRSDNNCDATDTFFRDEIPEIQITSASQTRPVTCNGDDDGVFQFTVDVSQFSPFQYEIFNQDPVANPTATPISVPVPISSTTSPVTVDNTVIPTGIPAGTYWIRVTDPASSADPANACAAIATVQITEPAAITLTADVDDADCGNDTGIITVTAAGGRGAFQYRLVNSGGTELVAYPNTTNIFTGLGPDTYTIFVRDNNGAVPSCERSITVDVEQTQIPTLALANGGDPCYDPTNQATQWVTITPGVPTPIGPFTYSLNGGAPVPVTFLPAPAPANTFEIPNLTPGNYTVTVTNTSSTCSAVAIPFTINEQLVVTASLIKDLDCTVSPEAQIGFSATGGSGTYTFTVVNVTTGTTVQTPATSPIDIFTAGTYRVDVVDTSIPNCTASSAEITVNPAPDPVVTSVDITNVACAGQDTGIITINIDTSIGTAPFEFSIDGGVTWQSSNTFSGLAGSPAPGTAYTYIVRDSKFCDVSDTVFITAPEPINANIIAQPTSCDGTGFSYGSVVVSGVTGGTITTTGYIYTLFFSNGTPVPDVAPAIFTTTANPTTTTANTVSFDFNELNFGTYYVTIEDENGCVFTTPTVTVESPPSGIDIEVETATSDCTVAGAILDIFILNGNRPFEIRVVGLPGFDNFIPTNGISTSGSVPPLPFVLDPTPGGNVHQYPAGTFQFGTPYIIEIRDGGGCIYRETIITPPAPSGITAVPNDVRDVLCFGEATGALDFTVDNYTGNDIQWEVFDTATGAPIPALNGNVIGTAPAAYSGSITNFPRGNYNVVFSTPSEPFCSATIQIQIGEPSELELDFVSQTPQLCDINGMPRLGTATVIANGGTPGYSFGLSVTGPFTNTTGTLDLADGTYEIYVQDANGCVAGPEPVTIITTPSPTFNTPLPIFVDDPCTFDGVYEFTVTVSDGIFPLEFGIDDGDPGTTDLPVYVVDTDNDRSFQFIVNNPGTYNYFVRDANGCTDTGTITVYPELIITAEIDEETTCREDDGTIIATVLGGSDTFANWTFRLLSGGVPIGVVQTPGPGPNQMTFGTNTPGGGLAPGTYVVEVVDIAIGPAPGGCTDTFEITIPTPTDPVATAAATDVSCEGGDDGTILITLADPPANPDAPYTYTLYVSDGGAGTVGGVPLAGPQPDPLFNNVPAGSLPLPAGFYDVVVTSDKGCTLIIDDIEIDEPDTVTATATQTPYGCNNMNDVIFPVITVTIDGGRPPYNVTYTGPGGISGNETGVVDADTATPGVQYEIIAPVAGPYAITVADSSGCPQTVTPNVDVPAFDIMTDVQVANIPPQPLMSCIDEEEVTVTVTGGSGTYTFERVELDGSGNVISTFPPISTAGNTAIFELPRQINTVFIFRVTDSGTMCTLDGTYTIEEFDLIEPVAVQETPVTCFSDEDGTARLSITGYVGSFDYEIFDNATGVSVYSSVASGTTLATDADPTTADIFVVPPAPDGLGVGTFRIDIIENDFPNCPASTVFNIGGPTEDFVLTILPINNLESCIPASDGALQATTTGAQGTVTYTIVPAPTVGPATNTTGLFENLTATAGTYTITATDANGCTDDETFSIIAPTPIFVDPIPDDTVTCFGDMDVSVTVNANGGQGPGTYIYTLTYPDGSTSTPGSNNVFTQLGPGAYTVTVSDNLNCETSTTFNVDEPNEVTISIDDITDVECGLDFVNVTVSGTSDVAIARYYVVDQNDVETPGGSGASHTFTGLGAGEYRFLAEDVNGCRSDLSSPVPVLPITPIAIILDERFANVNCFNEATGIIDATVSGGIGAYQFRLENTTTGQFWPGPTANDTQAIPQFTDLPPGLYTYYVTSERNCAEQANFEIVNPAEFVPVPPEVTNVLCFGEDNGVIVVFAQGGTPPYSFAISTDPGVFFNDASDSVTGQHTFTNLAPNPPGVPYEVLAQDANGCDQVYIVDITEPEELMIDIVGEVTPETCLGDSDGAVTVEIIGGTPPYQYNITNNDGDFVEVLDPTALLITDLPGGTTTVFIRDANNCRIELPVDIPPGVDINGTLEPALDCPIVDPITGAILQPLAYYVDFDAFGADVFDNNIDIQYILETVNAGDPAPIQSTEDPRRYIVQPNILYTGRMLHANGCERLLGEITVDEYIPLTNLRAEMTGNPEDPNEYEILVEGGADGNPDDYTYFVARLENVIPPLDPNDPPPAGIQNAFDLLTLDDYEELEENIFVIRRTGYYALRVVDNAGCELITVVPLIYINIRVPNYFTPGVDKPETPDDESYWYPRQITPDQDPNNPTTFFFENMEVRVFDRYGRLLAEFKGDQKGWDGVYKGKELPSGDYWYTVILNDAENKEFTGHFTLYR